MIRLLLHLLSKLHPDQSDGLGFEIQDVWESAEKALPPSTRSHHGMPSRLNSGDIMHDVNIEEKTNTKC